jgi:hypothetical protein
MQPDALRALIDRGIAQRSPIASRRRFYRLGVELLGGDYLERARQDPAASVRQWAARQAGQDALTSEEHIPLGPSPVD